MKQQVDIILRITAEADADKTREQLLHTAVNETARLQGLIQKPVTLMALMEEAEIYGNDETRKPIVVTVVGGNVQDVENIPGGVSVEIHDWDGERDDESADVAIYHGVPGRYEMQCEKALREIASKRLYGEELTDPKEIAIARQGCEYDESDSTYIPSCDTESSTLSDVIETARDIIKLIDG